MKLTKSKSLLTALLVSVIVTGGMSTSFAATQTQTLDMMSFTMPTFASVQAGDVLTLKISGLNGSEGVYVSVCDKSVTSATKSTLCDSNQAHMAWITADGANHSAVGSTGGLITVTDTFGDVDCKTTGCVLYVRGDHNNPTAYQLTRKIDLVFATGGVSKLADSVSGTAGGVTMTPNVPHHLTYRTPVKFRLTAKSHLKITLTSLTPDCSVAGSVVTALAGATACAIEATTTGNKTYSPLKVNFPFYTALVTLKRFGSANINRVKTNVDVYPELSSSTPAVCDVTVVDTKWKLTAFQPGTCTVVATSPEDASSSHRWTALEVTQTYVLTSIRKRS
jgi:hypothetical protein